MNDTLLWYATRGAGAVSLVLLTAVVALGILTSLRFSTRTWPRFLTSGLHRNLALMSVVFLVVHVVTAVVDPFTHLGWLPAVVPFSSYYRTFWLGLGTISAQLIAAVVLTSLVRTLLGHRIWRGVHWLAYASWPVGLAHSFGTGSDAGSGWFYWLGVACVAVVVVATGARLWVGSSDPLGEARSRFRGDVRGEAAQ